jgi:regulator of protease activity HflC (stomatin/prohibitin superfamily)
MSQIQVPGLDQNGPGGDGPPRRARRAASVTLREGGAQGSAAHVGDLMDPANKSLSDALRIAYRILQILIAIMIVAFIFSSTETVQTSEIGVRTTLGKIDRDDLEPGFHLSWPEPFGRIIKIARNEQTIELRKEFFPSLTDAEEKLMAEKGVQGLAEGGRDSLDADSDGALLTADGSLVHTRWQITYQRTKDAQSLRTISTEPDALDPNFTEKKIVNAVVRRAIIHAAATMTIDEVLYNQKDPARSGPLLPLHEVAKVIAQKQLDAMHAGIALQQFDVKYPMAPRFVMKSFNSVQTAQSQAKQEREQAEGESKNRLLKAAGDGAPVILALIDQYDRDLTGGDAAKAAATLQTIHDFMRRQPIQIDGKPVTSVVTGDVSRTVNEAEQYRTGTVTRASGDASLFRAKLSNFKSNPQVFLTGEWTDALASVLNRDTVQTMLLPPGLERLVMQINRDPSVVQEAQSKEGARKVEENRKEIIRRRQQELFQQQFNGTARENM